MKRLPAEVLIPAYLEEKIAKGMTTADDVETVRQVVADHFYRGHDIGHRNGYRQGRRQGVA